MAEAIHESHVDRRGTRRYRIPEGIFLVENAEGRHPIGDLLDISADGLSFIYSADVDAVLESTYLNIVSVSGEIQLEKIPYQNKNDFDFIRNYPFDAYRMRRRGVSFTELTEPQKESLIAFIDGLSQS
ncbi:MAG: hypothetical protein QNJ22_11185 [Desulfosarcinaceae bacterium]|nr:hypothetical protein [Desulfosarcinaceae bacterium]